MNELLEAIRAATHADAPDDIRAAGAAACRTILTALEANAGEPLVAMPAPAPTAMSAAVSALRTVPADQLLELAITKLKTMVPDGTGPKVDPVRFHIIQLPPVKR